MFSTAALAELSVRISAWISVTLRMSVSNYPYNDGYPWYTSRCDIRNTDIHADIGATDLGTQFTADIRGCTDNSTRTSVMLRVSKRISARTVRPG